MPVLIDRIRLRSIDHRAAFIQWVQEVDYAACKDLPSVQRFRVFACPGGDGLDFFEIVEISSLDAFAADTSSPLFQSLVARFVELAELGEQFSGDLLEPGFERLA